MSHFYLILAGTLLLAGCTSSSSLDEADTRTRTVYFTTATLEKTGQEVRVMIDSTATPMMGVMMTTEVRSSFLGLSLSSLEPEFIEQQRTWCPGYNVIWDWVCAGFWFTIGPIRYQDPGKEVYDFDRQERETGQHIDLVLGGAAVKGMFKNDLSQVPIDLVKTVPYDWGASKE